MVTPSMHDVHLAGIDLNLLPIVEALVSELNVTRAARKLGLSQSALSHALARARSTFDDPLLVRAGRHMVATPRAAALASAVRSGLSTIAHTLADGRGFDARSAQRTFTLAMSDYAEMVVLPPLMAHLRREAPGINIWVAQLSEPHTLGLAAGAADLGVGLVQPSDVLPGISHEALFDDDFVCVMRKGHPLSRGALTLERYCAASHLLVAPRGVRGGVVDDALAALGRTRRVALGVPHFLTAPQLVASSDLIATLAARLAHNFVKPLGLTVRKPPLSLEGFRISLVWHERLGHDPALAWLRRVLRELVRTGKRA